MIFSQDVNISQAELFLIKVVVSKKRKFIN